MPGPTHRFADSSGIAVGDRVAYNGQPGAIVVVVDDGVGSPGFPIENWVDQGGGFLIRFDNGALLFLHEPDRLLVRDSSESSG